MKRLLFGALFLPLLGSITYYPGPSSLNGVSASGGVLSVGGFPVSDRFDSLWFYEEFASGAGVTGQIGKNGILFNAVATGTTAATAAGFLTGGEIILSHATNDNSGGNLALGNSSVWRTVSNNTLWTTTDWSLDVVFMPGAEGTAITSVQVFVGLANSNTIDPIKAGAGLIGIRYDTDLSDATYICVTCDSATAGCASAGDDTNQKVAASTIAPSAGVSNRFRIRRAASGVGGNPTIYMRVNNETERTFCSSGCTDTATEIPAGTVALGPIVSYLTRTTTGVMQGEIDYLELKVPDLPARY